MPEPGDHEHQERQRGDRLDHARRSVRMTGPSRGRRAAMMPSGIATDDRRRQRDRHQREVLAEPAEQPSDVASRTPPAPSIPNFASRNSAATRSSGMRSILARAFIPAISVAVIRPSSRPEAAKAAGDRDRQVGAIEPDAFVRREELQVVAEHAQACTAGSRRRSSRGRWPGSRPRPVRDRRGRGRARGRRAGEARSGRAGRASRRPDP